jgi:hypothetical protein
MARNRLGGTPRQIPDGVASWGGRPISSFPLLPRRGLQDVATAVASDKAHSLK